MQWAYLALFICAQGFLVFRPLTKRLDEGGLVGGEQVATARLFLELHQSFWPALFVILVIAAAHSVFVSHRLVGPLVRIRHVLRALRDGERPDKVAFRTKDYLTEEASLLEDLSHTLREQEDADRAHWSEVKELVLGLEVAMESERLDVCGAIVVQLKKECESASVRAESPPYSRKEVSVGA